jgi:hypothetical protein
MTDCILKYNGYIGLLLYLIWHGGKIERRKNDVGRKILSHQIPFLPRKNQTGAGVFRRK